MSLLPLNLCQAPISKQPILTHPEPHKEPIPAPSPLLETLPTSFACILGLSTDAVWAPGYRALLVTAGLLLLGLPHRRNSPGWTPAPQAPLTIHAERGRQHLDALVPHRVPCEVTGGQEAGAGREGAAWGPWGLCFGLAAVGSAGKDKQTPGSWRSSPGPAPWHWDEASPTFPPCCRWSCSGSQWELGKGCCPQRLSWGGTGGDGTREGHTRTTSAQKPAQVSPSEDLFPMGMPWCPSGQVSQPSLPIHGQSIPKGGPQSTPGMPPPYLSPDSLFCGEEEEEVAEVEDLESAESLLAGQAPCQRW